VTDDLGDARRATTDAARNRHAGRTPELMGRPATGTVLPVDLADGTRHYRLRFRAHGERHDVYLHERRDCPCGCAGGWTQRTARIELDNILARVNAGAWTPPTPQELPPTAPTVVPTFHEYASRWLQAKRDGVLGERPIDDATHNDYLWRLRVHLLPYFATYRLDEIDRTTCLAFKEHKLREATELREAITRGADLRDRRGRRIKPLGPASLKKLLDALKAILDEAVEDGHLLTNPARSRRMRVRVPKPTRTFLEIDELVAVEDAAGRQDPTIPREVHHVAAERPESTAGQIADRVIAGMRPTRIAADLGLAKSTVAFHLARLGAAKANDYLGRRAIMTTLGRSGVRVSELCDMRISHLRLHDPDGARFHIPDAKTEAGIREVQMSPELAEVVLLHLDRLRRAGHPTTPEAWVFPNRRGGRLSRQRVAEIVTQAAREASATLIAQGRPPLPNTTPHTLRRTYISIALLANNFDVLWVMHQVGHADSKMTLDVYAQLQQRVKREHGHAFDKLVQQARAQFATQSDDRTEHADASAGMVTADSTPSLY
jgi:integrase